MRALLGAARRAASAAACSAAKIASKPTGKRLFGATAVVGAAAFSSVYAFDSAARPDFSLSGAKVMTWGQGGSGQLGFGESTINWLAPRGAEGVDQEDIVHIAAGWKHTAVLTKEGEVWTFGCGQYGRLGHGDQADQLTPRLVFGLDGVKVTSIACGGYHTAAVSDKGELYVWGRGWDGELGSGTTKSADEPQLVSGLKGKKVVQVSCGDSFTLALTDSGELYSFGTGYEGQLGHGSKTNELAPKKVEGFGGEKVTKIATGKEHCLAVTESGSLFSWGADDYGQLGVGKRARYMREPTEVRKLKGMAVDVAGGEYHSAVSTKDGKVYTFGFNKDGQLGNGGVSDQPIPRSVFHSPSEDGKREELTGIVGVACGGGHTAALTKEGTLWVWGRGRDGQLGRGSDLESAVAPRLSPLLVDALQGKQVKNVACGADHTVAIVL